MSFAVPATAHEPLDPAMIAANGVTTVEMTIADTGVLLAEVVETPAYGVEHLPPSATAWARGTRWGQGRPTPMQSGPLPACTAAGSYGTRPTRPTFTFRASGRTLYFAFAADDPTCPDEHKALIESTIAQSGVTGRTEHFASAHGWTFPERWCEAGL